MQNLVFVLMLTASLTAQGQQSPYRLNPKATNRLNVSGRFADTTVVLDDTVKLTGENFKHVSGGIVDGGYSRLVMRPTEFSGLTFNQSPWIVKTSQADNFTDLQINSKYDKPITFTIDDVVYLVYQKKVYKLLK